MKSIIGVLGIWFLVSCGIGGLWVLVVWLYSVKRRFTDLRQPYRRRG